MKHWADHLAEVLIKRNPNKKKFVLAAGITPSGKVHIGNFRDIITSELVQRALKDRGYKAELIFSWDDYDRLRKIPSDVPKDFEKYLTMPVSDVPDPFGCHSSYAKHFEADFEEVMPMLGIKARYIYQNEMYKANKYYKGIKIALQKRKEVAEILWSFKTSDLTKEVLDSYYPFMVYCENCNYSSDTKILSYDGENTIEYVCERCNHKAVVDLSKKNIGKLNWKIDWPMRWIYEGVDFEPGGADHSTQGGSYDVSKIIVKKIYGGEAPFYQGYGFVGIEGAAKMSSSKGTGILPKDMLEIYEPELLRWLYARSKPDKKITLYFDSEIIRQYDEYDRALKKYHEGSLNSVEKRAIEFSSITAIPKPRNVSFRQIASFSQIVQGNLDHLKNIYDRLGLSYDEEILAMRLEKAMNWVERYMPSFKIELLETANKEYYDSLSKEEKEEIKELIEKWDKQDLEELTYLLYSIPKKHASNEKEQKQKQRRFFKNLYMLLIGKEKGPRLASFLIALQKEKVKKLLDFE